MLHYHLNRNHPFVDGNKRFALTATEYFLDINSAMLTVGDEELFAFSLGVAAGTISRADSLEFFVRRAVRLAWINDPQRYNRWLRRLSASDHPGVDAWADGDGNRFDRFVLLGER